MEYDIADNEICNIIASCYFCDKKFEVAISGPLTEDEGNIIPCLACWDENFCEEWYDTMEGCIGYADEKKEMCILEPT